LTDAPKTTDLCDAREDVQACALLFQSYGLRRFFTGPMRTLRCFEDIGLMRDTVSQAGHGQVLVIDGGGSIENLDATARKFLERFREMSR
jgi:regulator of ribonuclease activity A